MSKNKPREIEVEVDVEFFVKTRAVVNVFTDGDESDPVAKAYAKGYVTAEIDKILAPVELLMDEDKTTLMGNRMIFSGGETMVKIG